MMVSVSWEPANTSWKLGQHQEEQGKGEIGFPRKSEGDYPLKIQSNTRPLQNLASLFDMRFLTHLRAHSLDRKNSA